MKIIALDISGNHGREGMGITGVCVLEDGEIKKLKQIKAKDYETEVEYWDAQIDYVAEQSPDHVVMEGYKLYNHKGKEAKIQANSDLQTPQLLGALKSWLYHLGIPYTIQYASEVKTRWQEAILVHLGHLESKGGKYYWKGKPTVTHTRDSMKHALHFWRYKGDKL